MWHNKEDIAVWRAIHIGEMSSRQTLKDIKKNVVFESLQPVKEAYKKLSTQQKTALLAEIIRFVTT